MKLSTEDKRTWISDTLYYMKKKDSNKDYYIETYGEDIEDLPENTVEALFEEMLNNGDIDLSDLYTGDVYGF